MTDKPTKEDVDKVFELDDKRTQGEWGIDVTLNQILNPDRRYAAICVACHSKSNLKFIASAPKMAQIIRHQQELLEEAYLMIKNVDFCLEKDCVDMMRSYKTTELLKKLQPILTNEGEE